MSELEIRLESQEQYFRRTSLRFHNIKVPVNERGRIISPVNTDDLILNICINLPGVNLTINDGIILVRTSGLPRASITLSVMFFFLIQGRLVGAKVMQITDIISTPY
jgi:hypothetical protein